MKGDEIESMWVDELRYMAPKKSLTVMRGEGFFKSISVRLRNIFFYHQDSGHDGFDEGYMMEDFEMINLYGKRDREKRGVK